MFLDRVLIDRKTQTWRIWNRDVSILNDWLWNAVNKISPEWDFRKVMFQSNEVLSRSRTMHGSHGADGRTCHVHCHTDPVFLREVTDLLRFQDPAARGD